jgi:hypothetical protein
VYSLSAREKFPDFSATKAQAAQKRACVVPIFFLCRNWEERIRPEGKRVGGGRLRGGWEKCAYEGGKGLFYYLENFSGTAQSVGVADPNLRVIRETER